MYSVLLQLRNSDTPPENPGQFIQQFFGDYRDPLWDEYTIKTNQIQEFKTKEQELTAEREHLILQIERAKRLRKAKKIFSLLDSDHSGILSARNLVFKLSGFSKFEHDVKMNSDQFAQYFVDYLTAANNREEEEEISENCMGAFKEVARLEEAKTKQPLFASKLDDPVYTRILDKLRIFSVNLGKL